MKENKIIAILAEDERNTFSNCKESLETRNFIVIPCKNGKEALETFYKEKADVLILDVMLPIKDGFSVAIEIRKTNKQNPHYFPYCKITNSRCD